MHLEEQENVEARERVLYVDDDAVARRAFSRVLRNLGYIVDLASGGAEALTLATQFPYAVVASDLRMPDIDGLTLIEELQRRRPDSSYFLATGATESFLPGSQSAIVIRKPWDNETLGLTVARGVELYRARQKPCPDSSSTSDTRLRVLLVEDNPSDRLIIGRQLNKSGYDVEDAGTAGEALGRLSSGDSFDVVITDLSLPDADGLEAVSLLATASGKRPLLVLSGQKQEATAFRALELGAQDYLLKGKFDAELLHRAIRYSLERKRADERLRFLAHYDQLTGVANRTLLTDRMKRALSHAQRRQELVGLMFIDLDRFKNINDSLGHAAGDLLLQEVARRLLGCVRDTDTVARMGGDEFALVLEGVQEREGFSRVADRILNSFATPIRLGNDETLCGGSIGIAIFPADATSPDELLKRADDAMYTAKRLGRGNARYFDDGPGPSLIENKGERRQ